MIKNDSSQNSEQALMSEIFKMTDAGAAVVQIRTREPIRTALVLRKHLVGAKETEYKEWDVVNGLRDFTKENMTDNVRAGDGKQFIDALNQPMMDLRQTGSSVRAKPDTVHYFVYVDAHPFLRGNPYIIELVQQYAAILPATNVCILFVTPEVTLDDIPSGTLLATTMPTPSTDELSDVLVRLVEQSAEDFKDGSELNEDDVQEIAQMGLGLSLFEFETYAALGLVSASIDAVPAVTRDIMLSAIAVGKTEVVKQSEILELYPTADMSEVGGMQRLKDWIESRQSCFTPEAAAFGIEHPKGAVVVGVPGTGKSLVAKAIASALGIPLVRFDMSRVFSKYVGDSEARIRAALKMAEDMAPCVLFVDEIDKGLGGASGGGDSGTSSRVLGSYLTWLNDCKKPIFNMVTANRVEGLPPELLRKGRFDQIFSVGLPTKSERVEVLHIHLRKRGHELVFDKKQTASFVEHSDGYVPAEIEAAVRDALILAFNEGSALGMQHITAALKDMIPMSVSNKTQIDAILAWAETNAIPVNHPEAGPELAAPGVPAPRRMTRRSTGAA